MARTSVTWAVKFAENQDSAPKGRLQQSKSSYCFSKGPAAREHARKVDTCEKSELGDGHDRRVEFPDRLHMHGAAGVVKVFKSHPQDVYWQG
jgi:hypothetical protein